MVSAVAKRGNYRFDTRLISQRFSTVVDRSIDENLQEMRDEVLTRVFAAMEVIAVRMEREAKTAAGKAWESHPDRHPSARWPGEETALEGIYAQVSEGTNERIGVTLGHSRQTVAIDADGRRYNYGKVLEERTGVIEKTFEAYKDELRTLVRGAAASALTQTVKANRSRTVKPR